MLAVVLGLAGTTPAGTIESNSRFRAAVDACYGQRYREAARLAEEAATADPAGPAISYWRASLVQMRLYDSGDTALIDSFLQLTGRSVDVCRARIAADPKDAGAHFYLGMTRLNLANCQSWRQQRSAALKTMLGVQPEMRAALKLDTGLVDAWFGLGAAEYFRSLGNRYFLGIGIMGSGSNAHKWVRRVADDTVLFQPVAAFFLAWMLGQDGRYEEALARCRALLERYPDSRTVLRTMRDIRLAQREYAEAARLGRRLDGLIRAAYPGNRYGLAENWIVTAKAWDGLAQADSVRHYAGLVVAWEKHRNSVPWLSSYLRDARALLARYPD